jgi:hypothetical protein
MKFILCFVVCFGRKRGKKEGKRGERDERWLWSALCVEGGWREI